MTYVKTYLPMLKTHIVYLKRDAKDLSRDLQRLEVRGKLGSKTLYHWNRTEITVLVRVCVCVCVCVKKILFGCGFNAGARVVQCTVDTGVNTSGAFWLAFVSVISLAILLVK